MLCQCLAKSRLGIYLLGTMLLLAGICRAQCPKLPAMRSVRGHVVKLKDNQPPAPKVTVGIYGDGSREASTHGEFELCLPSTAQDGSPITFWVDKWVVYEPRSYHTYGKIPLPTPSAEPISLVVVEPGSKLLLSAARLSMLLFGATEDFEHLGPQYLGALRHQRKPDSPPFLAVVARTGQEDERALSYFASWEQKTATELGFSRSELKEALTSWANLPRESNFENGLASLYLGNVSKALELLQQSDSRSQPLSEVHQALAFGYGLRREWSQAQKYLELVIGEGNRLDPMLHNNLGYALEFGGKSDQAAVEFKKARSLLKANFWPFLPNPTTDKSGGPQKPDPHDLSPAAGRWMATPDSVTQVFDNGQGCTWDMTLSEIGLTVDISANGSVTGGEVHYVYHEITRPKEGCGSGIPVTSNFLHADLQRSKLNGVEVSLEFPSNSENLPNVVAAFSGRVNVHPTGVIVGDLMIKRIDQPNFPHTEWTAVLRNVQLRRKE